MMSLTSLKLQTGPLVSIRSYATKLTRYNKLNSNVSTTTIDDLKVYLSYLENLELPLRQSIVLSNTMTAFKLSENGLMNSINDSLKKLNIPSKPSSVDDTPTSSGRLSGLSADEIQLLNKIKFHLKADRDADLYNLLASTENIESILPSFQSHLSPFQISLIIKRLADNHEYLTKNVINEQQFFSRLVKDLFITDVTRYKARLYNETNKIFTVMESSFNLSTVDYETIVDFHIDNMSYYNAIQQIERFETKMQTSEGHNLRMTNSIWAYKIKILTKSFDKTWSIGRYALMKNRLQLLPKDYRYPHHSHSILEMLKKYQNSKLPPDIRVYDAVLLGLAKAKDTDLLDNFILHVWGVDPVTGEISGNKTKRGVSLGDPTFQTLQSIILGYSFNNNILKGFKVCNSLIEKYDLDLTHSQQYWTTVLECTGLVCINIYRDIQTRIWKNGGNEEDYKRDFNTQYALIDQIWRHALDSVDEPSRQMMRKRLKYSSLNSLIEGLPQFHKFVLNPEFNRRSDKAIFNQNLLFSYLNTCRQKLQQRRQFYKAEAVVEKFSIDNKMKNVLLQKLKKSQERYLKKVGTERERAKRTYLADDEDDGLGLW
ncbi:hypothetical protein CANARDRAFT_24703 [[Candida] arabinofermentans NRRL YB-2248]|uniref:ATPase expression protein 2, mitochondrial n=1 Tax=[Candida] arabinofermentans NRRL YB-2248 TaxID=983967 RepID=A0A1E4SW77_9ASCO|nr:hypothetical protein CANARDRAFT_24703 [[Candida] arabinofermentans NRRL YB-2248]